MSGSPFTSTGVADEAAFTVVAPSKQQIHFREKQARARAWAETAYAVQQERARRYAVQQERARRWQEKESLAVNKERTTRAWKKEQAAITAKRATAEQQVREEKERKAKINDERTARWKELDDQTQAKSAPKLRAKGRRF
ncbi:hypothetical protein MMC15_000821 [Xylographa vitiligo]|nr:hypothetical protein [Xylographa vitiligo]